MLWSGAGPVKDVMETWWKCDERFSSGLRFAA